MGKKDYDYFKAFQRVTDYAYTAAEVLNVAINAFDTKKLHDYLEKAHTIEHEADELRHEIMEALAREFLPPIEREDIVELSNALDDIVDTVEDVLIGIYVYNVEEIREAAISYADVILQCCDAVKSMMLEFPKFQKSKKLLQYIKNVNHLEGKGDVLYSKTTRQIFTSDLDAVEVIKWRSIFDRMERACDACEEVSHLVESVVMKNS